MREFVRSGLAILAGLFVGFLVVFGAEIMGHLGFPPPPGLDLSRSESISEAMKQRPGAAFGLLLLGWATGSFDGSLVASRLGPGRERAYRLAVGGFLFAASVANMAMIPHPAWVWAVGLVECFPAAYLGASLAKPREGLRAGEPQLA